jgi:predicted metalloprotease with PDZ domain
VTGLLLAAFLGAAWGAPAKPVSYRLTYPGSTAARVRVEIELPDLPAPRTLVIPRAIPMGYEEAPYDRYVSGVEAFAEDGKALEVRRADGPRWRIAGSGVLRRVAYEVDLGSMEKEILDASNSSKVRPDYVGILGYSVFGFLEGWEDRPIRLAVRTRQGWPVFSTLAPAAPPAILGEVTAAAPDFYALADSQIAMGPNLRLSRIEARVPLFLLLYVETEPDPERTARVAREAFDAVADYFGSTPFAHYTVYVEILKPIDAAHRYGFSMEHLDSATFFLGVEDSLRAGSGEADVERTRYNFAHHIAHAWIPKRCYGEGYFPFTWELAPVIDTIWFSEGFAQYAAIAALARRREDGAAYREKKLQDRFRSRLEEAPDFIRRMSAVELSRVASTRYGSDFRTGSNSFARGGLMAAEMDDAIRARTGGSKSLSDALAGLLDWSRRERQAFRLEELPGLLQQGAGVDVRAIYDKWLAAPGPSK